MYRSASQPGGQQRTSRVINGKAPAPAQPLAAGWWTTTAPRWTTGGSCPAGRRARQSGLQPGEEPILPLKKVEPKRPTRWPDARKPELKPEPKPEAQVEEPVGENEPRLKANEKERRRKSKANGAKIRRGAENRPKPKRRRCNAGPAPMDEAGKVILVAGAYREEGNNPAGQAEG